MPEQEVIKQKIIKDLVERRTKVDSKIKELRDSGLANGVIENLEHTKSELDIDIKYERKHLCYPSQYVYRLSELGFMFSSANLSRTRTGKQILGSGALNVRGRFYVKEKGMRKYEIQEALWAGGIKATSRYIDKGLIYLTKNVTHIREIARSSGWFLLESEELLNDKALGKKNKTYVSDYFKRNLKLLNDKLPSVIEKVSLVDLHNEELKSINKDSSDLLVEALKSYCDAKLLTEIEEFTDDIDFLEYEIILPSIEKSHGEKKPNKKIPNRRKAILTNNGKNMEVTYAADGKHYEIMDTEEFSGIMEQVASEYVTSMKEEAKNAHKKLNPLLKQYNSNFGHHDINLSKLGYLVRG